MLVNCKKCNKEINKKPSQIKRVKNVFCSKECKNDFERDHYKNNKSHLNKKVMCKCNMCNKDFEIKRYRYEKFLSGETKNLFCSISCSNKWMSLNKAGKNSPNYNRVEQICAYCEKVYFVKRSLIGESKFCSRECKDAHHKINGRTVVDCSQCGAKIEKILSDVRTNNFCSRECSEIWSSVHKSKKVKKVCVVCGELYVTHNRRSDISKCCSLQCVGAYTTMNQKTRNTKPEIMVREFLNKNNIHYIEQHKIYRYIVDFYLPQENTVIEVQGDYWHGHPDKYGNEEGKTPLTKKQEHQIEKDKRRYKYLTNKGYNVHMIWECDIYDNVDESLSFLNNYAIANFHL